MTKRNVEKIIDTTEHPFEQILGVSSGTTEIIKTQVVSEPVEHESFDSKDSEIEEDILIVHDKALELYEYIVDELNDSDPSKKSRLAEVAGQLLNTALSATEKRRVMKQHKDVLEHKDRVLANKGGKKITNTTVFVGSFKELMGVVKTPEDDSTILEHEKS
jgi:hypothetical protein